MFIISLSNFVKEALVTRNDFRRESFERYAPGFLLKKHLAATYPYIRAENSYTGCTSVLRGFIKYFDIAVFCSL